MSGTIEGGRKAAKTNIEKYGKNFYAEIGRKGGSKGHTGGFASNPQLAKEAGRLGGQISRRGKNLTPEQIETIKREIREAEEYEARLKKQGV